MARNIKKGSHLAGHQKKEDYIKYLYYGLIILLVVSPLWKGVFLERDQLIINLLIGMLFLVALVKGFNSKFSLIDILIAFFVLINFMAIINGANKWLSIQAAYNYLGLFMVYLIAAECICIKREHESLYTAIFITGVAVAVIGLLSASDGLNLFERSFSGNRIGSTFGYANTLAVYLSAVLMIGLNGFGKTKNTAERLFLLIANYLILICLFGTQSRGGFITFAIMTALLFIYNWEAWNKNKALALIMCQLMAGGGIGVLFLDRVISKSYFFAWGLVLTGAAALIGFNYIFQRYFSNNDKADKYLKAIIFPAVVSIFLYGITKGGFIAYNLLGRIINLNINDVDIYHRIVFYKDAIKLIAASPLIGYGGGAWEAMYKTARSLPYYTTQVHNNILEIAVESGALGLLSFLGASLLLIIKALFTKSNRALALPGIIALGLFIHGIMDFDFSYGAIGIIFWSMLGVINGNTKSKGWVLRPVRFAAIIITVVFILSTCSLVLSIYYNDKIVGAQKQGDIDLMLKYAEKAARFNPFAEKTHMNIANIYFNKYVDSMDVKYMEKALEHVDYAIKYDRYQSDWYSTKANYLAFIGDARAVDYYKKAISINKYDGSEYADAANIELLLAKDLIINKENIIEGKKHLLQAIEIEKMAERQEKEVPKDYPWRTEWRLKHPKLIKTIGYVYIYLNDMEKAKEYFETSKKYNEQPMEWAEVLVYGYNIEAYDDKVINEVNQAQKAIGMLMSVK
ncbi:MAG: O-antigen ligase family protein [Peptococcaceae bacterium]|jgi:O-antigen ligase|nr:O-antigen ligase family protein [Peptococcaceae bacterium]